jgi:hypothetical protein
MFLLFDSVHLLKCIRNNWLNKKTPYQTFVIPSFDAHTNHETAIFQSIVDLYLSERNNPIKFAPNLSQNIIPIQL